MESKQIIIIIVAAIIFYIIFVLVLWGEWCLTYLVTLKIVDGLFSSSKGNMTSRQYNSVMFSPNYVKGIHPSGVNSMKRVVSDGTATGYGTELSNPLVNAWNPIKPQDGGLPAYKGFDIYNYPMEDAMNKRLIKDQFIGNDSKYTTDNLTKVLHD